jgi:hypothetical protein
MVRSIDLIRILSLTGLLISCSLVSSSYHNEYITTHTTYYYNLDKQYNDYHSFYFTEDSVVIDNRITHHLMTISEPTTGNYFLVTNRSNIQLNLAKGKIILMNTDGKPLACFTNLRYE